MVELDPDIITGYNIFGFDYSYIVERAKELECFEEFSKMSRIKNKECPLVNKQLSSSALGDNTLRYIEMFGRVQMDLLKVIQRVTTFLHINWIMFPKILLIILLPKVILIKQK